MLTDRFEWLFQHLVGAFKRHQDAPRVPERVVELAAARWDLELARNAIAAERRRIDSGEPKVAHTAPRVAVAEADLVRLRVLGIGSAQN